MLRFVIIGTTAFGVSTLTLFSGFGLGMRLISALAIFFPVEMTVATTAIVYLLNNLFKVRLLYGSIVSALSYASVFPRSTDHSPVRRGSGTLVRLLNTYRTNFLRGNLP